ncbi:MAG: hypothetical protein JW982_09560 [Spirochaetes bacterium]|nr:hypothetical protein [Spirochaetota bacterium]
MAGTIRTINNLNDIEKVLNSFFSSVDVFLKIKNGNLKIRYLGYIQQKVIIQVPYLKNMSEEILIFARKNGNTVYLHLRYIEKQGEDDFLLTPVKMQIIYAERIETRTSLSDGKQKSILFVDNVISDFIIENQLALAVKTVDRIKNFIHDEIEKSYERKKIYFMNEGLSDPRLKYFYENRSPYVVEDFTADGKRSDNKFYEYFISNIYSKDYNLINRKNLISEVAAPVFFKRKIPIGYIQVNHTKQLDVRTVKIVEKLALSAEEIFNKQKVFNTQTEKLLVTDISKNGLSIAFKERQFIRLFKENSYVVLSLLMPDNLRIDMLVIVKNITLLDNKVIKVGCQIKDIEEYSRKIFEHYLEE